MHTAKIPTDWGQCWGGNALADDLVKSIYFGKRSTSFLSTSSGRLYRWKPELTGSEKRPWWSGSLWASAWGSCPLHLPRSPLSRSLPLRNSAAETHLVWPLGLACLTRQADLHTQTRHRLRAVFQSSPWSPWHPAHPQTTEKGCLNVFLFVDWSESLWEGVQKHIPWTNSLV